MRLREAVQVVRCFGVPNLLHWVVQQAKAKTGWLRWKLPARPWAQVTMSEVLAPGVPQGPAAYAEHRRSRGGRFFFAPGGLPAGNILAQVAGDQGRRLAIEVADACCEGKLLYFSDRFGDLGRDVNWRLNPFTGAQLLSQEHWSRAGFFSEQVGDIKFIWEPSRFAWAYWLVRAFAHTGDEKYPTRFWELLESWVAANPPQLGPNWQSGQEAALRVMAVCLGVYAFADLPATTPERVALVARFLHEHGARIETHIGDAVRQKTNHALSEACGLWTIGLLFPGLRRARRWLRIGRRVLERESLRQIYQDGSYVQHSMNYHRVMLHVMIWAARLGELNGRPLDDDVIQRLERAGRFLRQVTDPGSGHAPNYGPNDGSLILPLDSCDYRDYRPALQAARYLTRRVRVMERGPWDEALIWLFGPEALDAAREPEQLESSRFDSGGYYTLRSARSWCMIRCHSYRDRPSDCDPLHVDLWWRGTNVLRDAGSFRYYCPERPDLPRYFRSIRAHNAIEVDGRSPMRMVSQFVQVPWLRGRVLEFSEASWRGEHYGYRRRPWNLTHQRTVELTDEDVWRITDEIIGAGVHAVVLRWHIPFGPWEWDSESDLLELRLDVGQATFRIDRPDGAHPVVRRGGKDEDHPVAWESLFYGRREPQAVLEVRHTGCMPVRFVTYLSLVAGRSNPQAGH